MVFNTFTFAIFLPIVFSIYWLIQRNLKLQNLFIVVASYLFYGWWDWRFLILIFITTICSWFSGLLISHYRLKQKKRMESFCLAANVILNLSILGFFKYFNFFIDNFYLMFGLSEEKHLFSSLNIILPVGISFYTFQALSYSIDVYRNKIQPTKDFIAFVAFISFFPQLVAGPIERATNLLPQFLSKRTFDYSNAVEGMREILWGLFKKMCVADNCAKIVAPIFADISNSNGAVLFIAAVLFAFQIYGDFSGYSDIARGSGKLFGISLIRNFHCPYFSRDIAEFWRRWHISLNTWFRDYLYIPLGGSRGSKAEIVRNTFIIFLVSGLWHGANWTFILWGAFHAILFVPLILFHANRKYLNTVAENRMFPSLGELCRMTITFLLVTFGWILFRAENMNDFCLFVQRMATHFTLIPDFGGKRQLLYAGIAFLYIAVMIIVEWIDRDGSYNISASKLPKNVILRWSFYCLLAFCCLLNYEGAQQSFIYFQF